MKDIESPRLLYGKAALLLLLGVLASVILLLEHPTLRTAFLLGVAVWAFARAYYFVFYVIEHYIDGEYKFAGLGSFLAYLWKSRRPREQISESAAASEDRRPASHPPRESDSID